MSGRRYSPNDHSSQSISDFDTPKINTMKRVFNLEAESAVKTVGFSRELPTTNIIFEFHDLPSGGVTLSEWTFCSPSKLFRHKVFLTLRINFWKFTCLIL